MPLYEYHCPRCDSTFDLLRPYSRADDPATCPDCNCAEGKRGLSLFASFSKSSDGSSHAVGGSSGCASCGASTCRNCSHGH
jgi:putative FmdB family regulatory protein